MNYEVGSSKWNGDGRGKQEMADKGDGKQQQPVK